MTKNSFHPVVGRQHSSQNRIKVLRIPVILTALFFLSSCSSVQDKSGYNLEKQIELQQVQHEMISEPIAKEKRTAVEFEELGDRYLLKGDINRAYLYYTKGLGVDPDNLSITHKQGALLLKKSKFIEAETVYEKLLATNNRDPLALEGRGKAYFGQGKDAEAEQDFLATLEISSEQWQSHEFLGLISSRRQEYDQAINRFKIALAHQPRSVSIGNNLAVTYYLNGNFKEALPLIKGFAKTSDNRKVYNNLALVSFQLGLYNEAMDAFKRGSENDAMAYNNMGYEFLTHKKYSEAIQAFEKAIELYPKFYPSAQKNLAIAKHALSNTGTEAGNEIPPQSTLAVESLQ
jgi:tetratricopeptide (TPR) repeat protein